MIPLRDTIPSSTFPFVTVVLIILNFIIFFFETSLGSQVNQLIIRYGIIPQHYFALATKSGLNFINRYYPFLTSMFLHGGWLHLIGNTWFLWIFGDNVEDRLGHQLFLFFYIFVGFFAGLAHVYTNANSVIPTIGASGAIAGVMGAYVIYFPRSRVLTLVPIFIFIQFIEIPAYVYLALWFVFQFFSGAYQLAQGTNNYSGIAWWAHIGGFLSGILLALLFYRSNKKKIIMRDKS
jgi:membrane associated rhomboid family serine protease